MILEWDGPFTFEELVKDDNLKRHFACAGVYIQAETQDGLEFASYIGKSQSSLSSRQFEHYRKCIGGLYTIPSYFRKADKPWVPYEGHREYLEAVFDKSLFLEVVREGFAYAYSIRIYLCALKNRHDIKKVERNLLYQIKPIWSYWGTLSKPSEELAFEFGGILKDRKDELKGNTESIRSRYKKDIEESLAIVYGKR